MEKKWLMYQCTTPNTFSPHLTYNKASLTIYENSKYTIYHCNSFIGLELSFLLVMIMEIRYKDEITKAFLDSKNLNKGLTDFVHYGRAVVGKKLTRKTLERRLLKILDVNEYPEFTLEEMMEHFMLLTNLKMPKDNYEQN